MHGKRLFAASAAATLGIAGVLAAVGAAAPAGATTSGSTSTSTAPAPPTQTSVALAADPTTGKEYAFWKGANGQLWQATSTSGTWSGPTQVGFGPLGSQPSAAILNGNPYVFWQGSDNNLWMADYTGTAWSGPTLVPNMGPLGSQPTVTATGANSLAVFWKGNDNNLWEATYDGTSWSGPTFRGFGPLGSAPVAGSDSAGNVYVFWQGTGNNTHVWEGWYNAAAKTWTGPIDLGTWTGNTGSAPTVAVMPSGQQYLYWQGMDGAIWQAYWNGSAWIGYTYDGMGPIGSQPAATATGDTKTGSIYLAWEGADKNLWTATYSFAANTLTGPTYEGMGPLS